MPHVMFNPMRGDRLRRASGGFVAIVVLVTLAATSTAVAAAPATHAAWLKQTHAAWVKASAKAYQHTSPAYQEDHSLRVFRHSKGHTLAAYRKHHPYHGPTHTVGGTGTVTGSSKVTTTHNIKATSDYVKPTKAWLDLSSLTCTQDGQTVDVSVKMTVTGGKYTLLETVITHVKGVDYYTDKAVQVNGGSVAYDATWTLGGVTMGSDGSAVVNGPLSQTIASVNGTPIGKRTISIDVAPYGSNTSAVYDGYHDTVNFTFDESDVDYAC